MVAYLVRTPSLPFPSLCCEVASSACRRVISWRSGGVIDLWWLLLLTTHGGYCGGNRCVVVVVVCRRPRCKSGRCGGQRPKVERWAGSHWRDFERSLKRIKPVTRGYGYGFLGGTKVCTRTRTLELPVTLPAGISVPVTIPKNEWQVAEKPRVDVVSSGVWTLIKPVVPVAGVWVSLGYNFGYLYPRATRDIYPQVSRTVAIPSSCECGMDILDDDKHDDSTMVIPNSLPHPWMWDSLGMIMYGLISFFFLMVNWQFHKQCMEVESSVTRGSVHGWSCPSCKNSNTKWHRC